jgi:hypothetical protein
MSAFDCFADCVTAFLHACLQAKLVIRASAKLAPSPVLNSVAAFLQAGLQTAANSNSAATAAAAAAGSEAAKTLQQQRTLQKQLQQGHMALEADVILLESVLPSLCDASVVTAAGLKEGLAALLQQLMAQRYREPLLVTLVSSRLRVNRRLLMLGLFMQTSCAHILGKLV